MVQGKGRTALCKLRASIPNRIRCGPRCNEKVSRSSSWRSALVPESVHAEVSPIPAMRMYSSLRDSFDAPGEPSAAGRSTGAIKGVGGSIEDSELEPARAQPNLNSLPACEETCPSSPSVRLWFDSFALVVVRSSESWLPLGVFPNRKKPERLALNV